MMSTCPAFDPTGPYVTQVAGFVDCHSVTLGEAGYRALGPGTGFGMAISGLLTIYVGLIGYRLLLGEHLTVRDGVWSALRLGFVLALATQWAAYQPLVYDVIVAGPADLAARVLAPGGLGGDAGAGVPGQLIGRVQAVHAGLGELIPAPADDVAAPVASASPGPVVAATPAPASTAAAAPALSLPARTALASADRLLVGAVLVGTLSVRVVAALLLALGPLFIGAMLFDATRGLFVGWVRVLAGAALAGIAAALVISLELAVIEPQLAALRELLDTRQPLGMLPQDMLATSGCFAAIMLVALIAVAKSAAAFHLPAAGQRALTQMFAQPDSATATNGLSARGGTTGEQGQRSRAEQIADAARASQAREARSGVNGTAAVTALAPREPAARQAVVVLPLSLGQAGLRTSRRLSPSAGRRDGTP